VSWALLVELRPVLAAGFGVLALLTLILRARMDAFLALILVSILAGIAAGLAPAEAFASITAGMGGTLGFIAVVIGMGALFGAILEATGGISALAEAMVRGDAAKGGRLRMGVLGLLVSTPVFFDVGLIILAPLLLAMGKRAGRPAMAFGLPLLAGLAAAHAMIPPTPGPLAVAELLGADLSLVIAFGAVVGFVAMLVGGPLYAALLERSGRMPDARMAAPVNPSGETIAPPAGAAGKTAAIIALPLLLILAGTLGENLLPEGAVAREALVFIGHPFSALLAGCGAALFFLGGSSDAAKARMKDGIARALEPTGAVILVTGAGGAFKQVLIDSGGGEQLANAAQGLGLAPLVAGFVLAGLMRVAQGSATVAMITAAGLLAPVAEAAGLSGPQVALVATAIASGALILSHVNDSGFWLVSRLFGLTVRQTLQTWTVTSTLVGCTGFAAAAALYVLV
jgi:gluconate transporter